MPDEKFALNRRTMGRLRRAASMLLKSGVSGKAKGFGAALLVLMLCINGMNVINSYVGRDFMSAIEHRDMSGFIHYGLLYAAVFVGSTVVAVFFRFSEERLGLLWRDFMTARVVKLYIDQRIYLHLEETGSLTNPDQRISEDVKMLTVSTLSLILLILNGTVTAISFSGVLWTISPQLFFVAVTYAGAGSICAILLGRPLIGLNYKQSDREADLRSELIRVREHAEGIALTGNEGRVRDRLLRRLGKLVDNFRDIVRVNLQVNFFTTGYNYMIQLIPIIFIAPMFIRGEIEFGVIGQSAMAFATLLGAFSLIITQFQSISTYAAVIARLGELVEASDRAAARDVASCIGCSVISDQFAYDHLTLKSTQDPSRTLLNELVAWFPPGKRVLITGPNQAAKEGLFRASAGLYDAGTGAIIRPPVDKMAFLPEQPYLPPSTLREMLVATEHDPHVTDDAIEAVVREVGLAGAMAKYDDRQAIRNWQEVLTFPEQQLAAVARVLLARPDFVFLNHLNTALPERVHKYVLKLMAERGITCISVGEGSPDPDCHDASLELFEDGTWKWTEITPAS